MILMMARTSATPSSFERRADALSDAVDSDVDLLPWVLPEDRAAEVVDC